MDVTMANEPQASRFTASAEGRVVGAAEYVVANGLRHFTHTEVDPELQGQGIAGRLARFALDDTRAQGFRAVPHCSYIAAWIDRHPDYADLVVGTGPQLSR